MVSARLVLVRAFVVVLLVAGAACSVMHGTESAPEVPGPRSEGSAGPSGEAPSGDDVAATRPSARPVSVSIPAIGVRARLDGLGLNPDGTVEVPSDPDAAGWYRFGTRPGARGSAVILGHVDSVDGPAVFDRLSTLRRGDSVVVELADGSPVGFVVRSVTAYPNAQFPARRVYATTTGRTLNLVTCGGAYDAARGGYQANVVVNARWVRTRSG